MLYLLQIRGLDVVFDEWGKWETMHTYTTMKLAVNRKSELDSRLKNQNLKGYVEYRILRQKI